MTKPAQDREPPHLGYKETLGDRLRAWGPIDAPGLLAGQEKRAWKSGVRKKLERLPDESLVGVRDAWKARYDDVEAARASVNGRANALLLFVGVVLTGAGLLATAVVRAPQPVLAVTCFVGGLLLIAALGAAFFAVRAQLVAYWDAPWIEVDDAGNPRAVLVYMATEMYVAAHQNRLRLQAPVVLLAEAQRYARLALFLIATVAILIVLAALAAGPVQTQLNGSGSSGASATPGPSNSGAPTTTPIGPPSMAPPSGALASASPSAAAPSK